MPSCDDIVRALSVDIGVRQAGTPAAAEAAAAIRAAFLSLGLEVVDEEFPLLGYEAGQPELVIDGESWQVAPCMYAEPAVCTGRVRRLGDGVWEVGEGRVLRSIFGRGPTPFVGKGSILAVRPTAFISRSDAERVPEGASARLVTHGRFVPGRRDRNVIASLPGQTAETIVVGAHFDSVWGGPGAVDNASGVAGLIAVAERLVSTGARRTLRFVAFGAEEVGLVGARYHVAEARACQSLGDLVAMINLDTIARGDRLQLIGADTRLANRAQRIAAELGLDDRYDIELVESQYLGTDHVAFEEAGTPSISFVHFPYEEYHLPEDTHELVDWARLDDTVELAARLAMELAA